MRVEDAMFYCPACSAVFGHIEITYEEPVLFKTGPKKGQVKDIVKRVRKLAVFSEPSLWNVKVNTSYSVAALQEEGFEKVEKVEMSLHVCPKCGAVFNDEFPRVQISKVSDEEI